MNISDMIPGFSTAKLVMTGALLAAIAGAGLYVVSLRNEVAVTIAMYQTAVSERDTIIDKQKTDIAAIQKINIDTQIAAQAAQAEVDQLRTQLDAFNIKVAKTDLGDAKAVDALQQEINQQLQQLFSVCAITSKDKTKCALPRK